MTASVTPIAAAAAQAAEWFGLESYDPARPKAWERVELFEQGMERPARNWPVGAVDPREVAARFGPGVYRVVWLQGSRKRRIGSDQPFKVQTPAEAAAAAAAPAPAPAAAPVAQPRSMAALAASLLPEGANTNDPAAMFVLVHSLSMQTTMAQLEQARLAQQAQYTQQQQAFSLMLEQQRQFFEAMRRAEHDAQERVATAQRPNVAAELEPLTKKLDELSEQMEELMEDDETEETDEAKAAAAAAAVAQQVEPAQAERLLLAFSRTVDSISASPFGPFLARALAQKMGVPVTEPAAAE